MAALQNPITPLVRTTVAIWIGLREGEGFTYSDISKAIELLLPHYRGVDISKAVSNELIRMVDKGLLSYTMLERKGDSGRPPRLYTQITSE